MNFSFKYLMTVAVVLVNRQTQRIIILCQIVVYLIVTLRPPQHLQQQQLLQWALPHHRILHPPQLVC